MSPDNIPPYPNSHNCLPHTRLERPYNNWVSPSLPQNPILALCETEAEVIYVAQRPDLKIDTIIVLSPQAACQCYLQGIPYYKLEDFHDVTAFWYGDEPMLALQSRWADQIDAYLGQVFPEFRKLDFRPAESYFFFLKVVIDMLFRSAFGLAHLLIASHPQTVFYFTSQNNIDDYPLSLGERNAFFQQSPIRFCSTDLRSRIWCISYRAAHSAQDLTRKGSTRSTTVFY